MGVVKGVVNVSLKAAGSYISMFRKGRPMMVTGDRNGHAAPSVITFISNNRHGMNSPTGHRTVAGPAEAVFSVGHFVNRG